MVGIARAIAVALLLLGGCYSPSAKDCSYTCNAGACPSGLTCVSGYCRENPNATSACSPIDDALVADMSSIDARIPPYAMVVMADDPFAWWRLSDPAGTTAVDENNNANPGTVVGMTGGVEFQVPGFLAGDTAAAFRLNQVGCIRVGDFAAAKFSATSDFTVEAWVKINAQATAEVRHIVSKLGLSGGAIGWEFALGANGAPRFRTCNGTACGGVNSGTPLAVDTWVYLVTTYNGADTTSDTAILYVNTVPADTAVMTEPTDTSSPVAIGCHYRGATPEEFFDGTIDEVALYNRVLTPAEITEHYEARL